MTAQLSEAEMIFTPDSRLGRAHADFSRIAEQRNPLVREKEAYRAAKAEAEALIASLTATSPDDLFAAAAAAREKIKVLDAALLDVERRLAVYQPQYNSERANWASLQAAWQSTSDSLASNSTSPRERERLLGVWRKLTGRDWEEQ